jgi:hypothetical protein
MGFVEELLVQQALPGTALAQRVAQRFGLQVHPRSIERARARRKKKRQAG